MALHPEHTESVFGSRFDASKARLPTLSGEWLGGFLLEEFKKKYKDQFPFGKGNDDSPEAHRWRMFCEIVTRNCFDFAGNRYINAQDGSQFSAFDTLFRKLKSVGAGEGAFRRVLRNLPSYSKGFVQTPHPTEVLTDQAIQAEQKFYDQLEVLQQVVSNPAPMPTVPMLKKAIEPTLNSMAELLNALVPPKARLNTDEEITRSILFSEKMFDSIPVVMQTVIDGAKRQGMYHKGEPLTKEELDGFKRLIRPETWSPGDRDSKDEMTAAVLERGIARNRKAMLRHYVKEIAEMVVQPETRADVKDELRVVMCKLMNSLNSIHDMTDYVGENKGRTSKEALAEMQTIYDSIYKHSQTPLSTERYEKGKELVADLENIRASAGDGVPRYQFSNGRPSDISCLDALIAQAGSFGFSALRSQIRENSEMHSVVMKTVMDIIGTRGQGFVDIDGDKFAAANTAERRTMLDAAMQTLMDNPELGRAIHKALLDKLESVKHDAARLQAEEKSGKKLDVDEKRMVQFYETLQGFKIAAEHPEVIPRYLIAECHGANDMLEAFFMLKAMESDEARAITDTRRRVGIIPLVEHRKDVENISAEMASAYQNRYFREHHDSLSVNDPMLMIWDEATQKNRRMTVAEVKTMYDIPVLEGDENKTVQSTKISMFAGSDITKSVGCAGAGLVLHETNRLRESMLNQEPPVLLIDYTGSGGGLHRSQPVASMYETVQGRSMRQTAVNIAQKILLTTGRYLLKKLGISLAADELPHLVDRNNSAREQVLTAQLNLGNMVALPYSEERWKSQVKARLNADMDKYEALYKDPAYAAYMGFTANPFVKQTSYAARSPARVGARQTDDFPPLEDVKNLRAIGYGAALNASGSCASYYYGASQFLGLDEQGHIKEDQKAALKELYLQDPIAQDRINRATYGAVMANMNAAWQYFGVERENVDINALAQETDGVQQAKERVAHDPDQVTVEDKRLLAMHVLAKIDLEHQKVTQGLLELNEIIKQDLNMKPKRIAQKTRDKALYAMSETQKQLLEHMPIALRDQIIEARKQIDPARHSLAKRFTGLKSMPDPTEVNPEIYYPMGVIFECFENAPRAYTRVRWAIQQEQDAEMAQAVSR